MGRRDRHEDGDKERRHRRRRHRSRSHDSRDKEKDRKEKSGEGRDRKRRHREESDRPRPRKRTQEFEEDLQYVEEAAFEDIEAEIQKRVQLAVDGEAVKAVCVFTCALWADLSLCVLVSDSPHKCMCVRVCVCVCLHVFLAYMLQY